MKELYMKYKTIVTYLLYGVLTTVVSVASYFVCYDVLGISNVYSTMVSWFLAVVFAFVTNKLFVFDSKKWGKNAIRETGEFILCRIGTGILELALMYLTVDLLLFDGTLMKIMTNVIIVILNYVLSKLFIFKK